MTIVTGRGLELSLTEQGLPADESQAQMLAAVGHPPSVIERESGVSASKAQMYATIYEDY